MDWKLVSASAGFMPLILQDSNARLKTSKRLLLKMFYKRTGSFECTIIRKENDGSWDAFKENTEVLYVLLFTPT